MGRLTCWAVLVLAVPAWAQFGGPAKVVVADVELRDLPASVTLVGTVQPVTRSVVGSEIAGLVERMPVRQGDFLRTGELICKLKDDTVAFELTEAREWLKSLQAAHRRWVYELERIQHLYGAEDAAEKEVYETRAEHDQAVCAVAQQKVVVDRLENELTKTEIRAPYSGFIVNRRTEVGQWLAQGGDVVDMVDLATVLVRVDLPERALPFVHSGDRASVKIEALGQAFEGRVRHVMLQADPAARTFPVDIEVPNPGYVELDGEAVPHASARRRSTVGDPASGAGPDTAAGSTDPAGNSLDPEPALLAGGMFARVTIQAGPEVKTPAVPKDAVVTRTGVGYVCMVTPGREEGSLMAVPVPVTTGVDVGDWIAVTSGNLAPGMQVITKGNENILFPSPIEIVKPLQGMADAAPAAPHSPPKPKTGS